MFAQILHYFNAGGLVMYPLIIFFFAATTIGIERFGFYRKYRGGLETLQGIVETKRESSDWEGLLGELQAQPSPLNEEVYGVISTARNRLSLQNRLEDLASTAGNHLKYGLDWLSMIVTMAPLLGLLGTVIGMIGSFNVMGTNIGDSPMVITGGVSEALIATATGLCVAVVALMFHSCCAHRTNLYVSRLETALGRILDIYDGSRD